MEKPAIQSQDKTSKYDGIEEALDVETSISPVETEDVSLQQEQVNKDYEYTRGNLYSLIEKGQEAVDGILDLAQQSDSPRAYEVAGNMIKNVADTTDKLMDLQKKLQEVEGGGVSAAGRAHRLGSDDAAGGGGGGECPRTSSQTNQPSATSRRRELSTCSQHITIKDRGPTKERNNKSNWCPMVSW